MSFGYSGLISAIIFAAASYSGRNKTSVLPFSFSLFISPRNKDVKLNFWLTEGQVNPFISVEAGLRSHLRLRVTNWLNLQILGSEDVGDTQVQWFYFIRYIYSNRIGLSLDFFSISLISKHILRLVYHRNVVLCGRKIQIPALNTHLTRITCKRQK